MLRCLRHYIVAVFSIFTLSTVQCYWKIGQRCLALYSEDELWYEAVILDIYMKENVALVEFDWYKNKEEVKFQYSLILRDLALDYERLLILVR